MTPRLTRSANPRASIDPAYPAPRITTWGARFVRSTDEPDRADRNTLSGLRDMRKGEDDGEAEFRLPSEDEGRQLLSDIFEEMKQIRPFAAWAIDPNEQPAK